MKSVQQEGHRPRRGRKPKGERTSETGLGATINARVAWDTRRAIEAEADRTGRSISQVCDAWLQRAQAISTLGSLGPAVEDAGTALFKLATRVCGKRYETDVSLNEWIVREAIHAGWRYLIDRSLPTISGTPQMGQLEENKSNFLIACEDLENATTTAQENEKSSLGLEQYFRRAWPDPFADMADAKISAKRLVYSFLTVPSRRTIRALDQLSRALDGFDTTECEFSAEVAACQAAIPAYRESLAAYISAQKTAASIGISLAREMTGGALPPADEPEGASVRE